MTAKAGNKKTKETKTGRYVYDRKLGKVVKVSDEIVGLKKGGGAESSGAEDSCPMNSGEGESCDGCGYHG